MAAGKKYLSLEEAAALLRLKNDELIRLREQGAIRGFADRGSWKFKSDDVAEFARRRYPDSDPELILMTDDDLGERIIGDPALQTFSSSETAVDDDDPRGQQATVIHKVPKHTTDSDVRLVLDSGLTTRLTGSSDQMPVLDPARSDSDVRLVGDSSPRSKSPNDHDVQRVDPVFSGSDSDSDVRLVSPLGSDFKRGLEESDSDVRLLGQPHSDSDVRLAPLADSDSDVLLVSRRRSDDHTGMASDSHLALLAPLVDQQGDTRGAVIEDLNGTDVDSNSLPSLTSGSSVVLSGERGFRLGADSGIQLRPPADSGILLEGDDSGIQLSADDSGIQLSAGDSSLQRTLPGRSSQTQEPVDDLDATAPLLLKQVEDSPNSTDQELSLFADDESDTAGKRGQEAVVMFEDDFDDSRPTGSGKSRPPQSGHSGLDLDDDDELEVSDEILGEDDELDELDAFDSDGDEFHENGVAGVSQIGFGSRQDRMLAPHQAEWGTGLVLGLMASTLVMSLGAILSVDLLRTTWAGNESSVYPGELIGLFAGLFQ